VPGEADPDAQARSISSAVSNRPVAVRL